MDAAWGSPEVIGDAERTQTAYVQANTDRDSSQEAENGNETRETQIPERPEKPRRKRGRIAKDPLNQTFLFECRDADDLETSLRDFLKDTTSPPEHTTVEFRFPASAAFMVYPAGHSQAVKDPLQRIFSKKAVSVVEALQPTYNPKDQIEKQRSIAKICVETVAKADGFKYGFNNNWISKEDGASRFSYFCNDSSLNKARAGNPAASNRVAHKKAQKPVYECEGTIAVKFYNTKQMLEVLYKHIPCHESYAARAPIPRKGTRRRLLMEVFEPDKLPAVRTPGGQGNRLKYEKRKAKLSLGNPGTRSGCAGGDSAPRDPSQEGLHAGVEPASASNQPSISPAEKLKDLQKKRKATGLSIPGTMSGFMDGDEIRMGEERPNKRQGTAKKSNESEKRQSKQDAINLDDDGIIAHASAESTALQGQAAPVDGIAAPTATIGQPSELDMLKAKLAQAEQQIQRLEAAQGSTAPPPPQPYYHAPPGYYQPPPPQYQYPPGQHWPPYPAYGPPPQQVPPHQAARPGANVQFKNMTHAGFGVLKPPRPIPSSLGATPQFLSGIVEAAASASGKTNDPSGDKPVPSQTVDQAAAGAKPAIAAASVTPQAEKVAGLAPYPETSADATSATAEPATSTPAPDTAGDGVSVVTNSGAARVSNIRQKSTLASRVASSMSQVRFYSPKPKHSGGPL